MNNYLIFFVTYCGRIMVGFLALRILFVGLGEVHYGLYVLALSLTNLMSLFDLGLSNVFMKSAIITKSFDKKNNDVKLFLTNRNMSVICISIAFQIVALIVFLSMANKLYFAATEISNMTFIILLGAIIGIVSTVGSWMTQVLLGFRQANFVYIFAFITSLFRFYAYTHSIPDLVLLLKYILLLEISMIAIQIFYFKFMNLISLKKNINNDEIMDKIQIEMDTDNQNTFMKLSTLGWFSAHFIKVLLPTIMEPISLARFDILSKPFTIAKPMLSNVFSIFATKTLFTKNRNFYLTTMTFILCLFCLGGLILQDLY